VTLSLLESVRQNCIFAMVVDKKYIHIMYIIYFFFRAVHDFK
jgi:hypothetical protein